MSMDANELLQAELNLTKAENLRLQGQLRRIAIAFWDIYENREHFDPNEVTRLLEPWTVEEQRRPEANPDE